MPRQRSKEGKSTTHSKGGRQRPRQDQDPRQRKRKAKDEEKDKTKEDEDTDNLKMFLSNPLTLLIMLTPTANPLPN
jgi:hypothetical protein